MENFRAVKSDSGRETFKRSSRKVAGIKKSLAIFVQSLQGYEVSVELKNDTKIFGVLEEADKNMNLVLVNATESRLHAPALAEGAAAASAGVTATEGHTDQIGGESIATCIPSIHISGASIRYILFPPSIKTHAHLSSYLRRLDYLHGANKPQEIKDKKKREIPGGGGGGDDTADADVAKVGSSNN